MSRDRYSYPKFVAESARHCNCCTSCAVVPCEGVLAGGLCDDLHCVCDVDDSYSELDYDGLGFELVEPDLFDEPQLD